MNNLDKRLDRMEDKIDTCLAHLSKAAVHAAVCDADRKRLRAHLDRLWKITLILLGSAGVGAGALELLSGL